MTDTELLAARYRQLVTKVIYDDFDGQASEADRAELDRLAEEVIRRSSIDFDLAA